MSNPSAVDVQCRDAQTCVADISSTWMAESLIFPCGFGHQLLTRDTFGKKMLTCSAHNWWLIAISGAHQIFDFPE
jgi:hypothetical protein